MHISSLNTLYGLSESDAADRHSEHSLLGSDFLCSILSGLNVLQWRLRRRRRSRGGGGGVICSSFPGRRPNGILHSITRSLDLVS